MEVVPGDPEYLPLPDDVRCFYSLNHCCRRRRRSRPLHYSQTPFHMSVIGFDRVVCVPASPLPARRTDLAFRLQLANCSRVTPQAISGEHVRRPVVLVGQRLAQKDLCRFAVASLGQIEVNRLPVGVDGPEQVHLFRADADEGLVHVPGGGFPLHVTVQLPIQLRAVRLCPAPEKL